MHAPPQTEIAEVAVALGACAMPHIGAGAAGSEPAEAIVDAALQACVEAQERIRTILARTAGETEAEESMQEWTDHARDRLIRAVWRIE